MTGKPQPGWISSNSSPSNSAWTPTRALLAELGNPQDKLKIIHIAGTNGKGSVGATLLSILFAAGYRTGFYFPHPLVRNDSASAISLFQQPILPNWSPGWQPFLQTVPALPISGVHHHPRPALVWGRTADRGQILETGLGGRPDATNVVTPLVSIITDISRDHEQHLGSTLEAIAREKAGIIKPKVPVICAGRAAETVPVMEARCREQQSPLFLYGRDFSGERNSEGRLKYRPLCRVFPP